VSAVARGKRAANRRQPCGGELAMAGKAVGLGLAAVIFGSLTVGAAQAADVNAVMATCANCHGKDGASTEPGVPVIGGVSAPYLGDNIAAYKKKARPCPPTELRAGDKKGTKTDMCEAVKDLSDGDIKQIAEYLASKKFVRAPQTADAALATKGKAIHQEFCEKCHSNNGSVAGDDAGILAGQWIVYLKEAFAEYAAGSRQMPQKMKPMLQKVDKAGTDALANYYGSMK
jgi:cytochrome subunit of sulfide dehydrogenase